MDLRFLSVNSQTHSIDTINESEPNSLTRCLIYFLFSFSNGGMVGTSIMGRMPFFSLPPSCGIWHWGGTGVLCAFCGTLWKCIDVFHGSSREKSKKRPVPSRKNWHKAAFKDFRQDTGTSCITWRLPWPTQMSLTQHLTWQRLVKLSANSARRHMAGQIQRWSIFSHTEGVWGIPAR